jgi:hypothetical protein
MKTSYNPPPTVSPRNRLITEQGVAVGGDTASGMIPIARRVAGLLPFRRL